jgi:hypothetical protein
MDFVDHGLVPGRIRTTVVAPGECLIDYFRERAKSGVVAFIEAQIGCGAADGVSEERIIPAKIPSDGARIWIEDDLVRIKAVTGGRLERAVDSETIELTRVHIREISVPDLVCARRKGDSLTFVSCFRRIEETKLDLRRVLGEKGEVRSGSIPNCAEGIRAPH